MRNGEWELGNENWEMRNIYIHIFLSFSRGIFGHIMPLNQLFTGKNIIIPS